MRLIRCIALHTEHPLFLRTDGRGEQRRTRRPATPPIPRSFPEPAGWELPTRGSRLRATEGERLPDAGRPIFAKISIALVVTANMMTVSRRNSRPRRMRRTATICLPRNYLSFIRRAVRRSTPLGAAVHGVSKMRMTFVFVWGCLGSAVIAPTLCDAQVRAKHADLVAESAVSHSAMSATEMESVAEAYQRHEYTL